MHHLALANGLITEANKHGNVKSIVVEIGELSNISAEDLKDAMEQMVDFQINMIKKKAEVSCECGYTGRPKITHRTHDHVFFQCPKCGRIPRISDGNNIILKEIEVF